MFGATVFRPDIAGVAASLALAAVPAIAGLTIAGFALLQTPPPAKPATAARFAAIGMILDAVVLCAWPAVYPDMPSSHAGYFGAYMLWCNAVALLTGVVAGNPMLSDARGIDQVDGKQG